VASGAVDEVSGVGVARKASKQSAVQECFEPLVSILRATVIVSHRSEQPKRTEPLKGKKGVINEPASMIGADG
jgi:hypothetical protein